MISLGQAINFIIQFSFSAKRKEFFSVFIISLYSNENLPWFVHFARSLCFNQVYGWEMSKFFLLSLPYVFVCSAFGIAFCWFGEIPRKATLLMLFIDWRGTHTANRNCILCVRNSVAWIRLQVRAAYFCSWFICAKIQRQRTKREKVQLQKLGS